MSNKAIINTQVKRLILYRLSGLSLNLSKQPISRLEKISKKNANKSLSSNSSALNLADDKKLVDSPSPNSPSPKSDLIFANNNHAKSAQKLALAANSIDELTASLDKFNGCEEIRHFATNRVFFDGNPEAKLLIIGEAPGSIEDQLGKPFVGQSGQLLDLMLSAIKINSRQDYLISNTVFWRPPGNRTPTELEIQSCFPFVLRLIQLSRAKVILTLGKSASKQILCSSINIPNMSITKHNLGDFPMRDTRGKVFDSIITTSATKDLKNSANDKSQTRHYKIIPSFHPSYLLRDSRQKAKAYIDMLKLSDLLLDEGNMDKGNITEKSNYE